MSFISSLEDTISQTEDLVRGTSMFVREMQSGGSTISEEALFYGLGPEGQIKTLPDAVMELELLQESLIVLKETLARELNAGITNPAETGEELSFEQAMERLKDSDPVEYARIMADMNPEKSAEDERHLLNWGEDDWAYLK